MARPFGYSYATAAPRARAKNVRSPSGGISSPRYRYEPGCRCQPLVSPIERPLDDRSFGLLRGAQELMSRCHQLTGDRIDAAHSDGHDVDRDFVAYIDDGLQAYLRGYTFWLDQHRVPRRGEALPAL